MFDPEKLPASAGGFPWKADGDFRTVVYFKNETNAARKYTVHLLYEGGQYSLGVNDIKPHQTVAVDFRELRDSQTPDSMGRVIPLILSTGRWYIVISTAGILILPFGQDGDVPTQAA